MPIITQTYETYIFYSDANVYSALNSVGLMYKSEYSPPQTAPLNALRIDYSNGAKSQSGGSISTSAKINRASRVRIALVMSGEGKDLQHEV
jgi:hypothetical protein